MPDRISLTIEAPQPPSDRGREELTRQGRLLVRVEEPHDVAGGARR